MKNFDSLKWLCVLSLIGFLYCFVSDLGYFFLFLDSSENIKDSNSIINIIIENLSDNGFGFDHFTASQLKKLYAIRVVFDVLAMVGVTMMYLKIKLGWTFYWIFQVAYVLSPFMLLDFEFTANWPYFAGFAVLVTPIFNSIIHLIYVLLFFSQKKNLS